MWDLLNLTWFELLLATLEMHSWILNTYDLWISPPLAFVHLKKDDFLAYEYTVKNFREILRRWTRDIKRPSLGEWKLHIPYIVNFHPYGYTLTPVVGSMYTHIVNLYLVVNFTKCFCIIPNFGGNYTICESKITALDGKLN